MKHILITGASSGLGKALALAYARDGVSVAISGRDRERLAAVAHQCRALGAHVEDNCIDVTERQAMKEWLYRLDDRMPLDLVIANAGISLPQRSAEEMGKSARRIFAVNVEGVFNTVNPILPRMTERGRGHIALMASMAGYRGMPGAPAYAASKAAVKSYGEGLRGWARRYGVKVSVICPGFVESRMTARNRFPMPFLMDADKAAAVIVRGIARNRGRIAFPWPMAAAAWLLTALPDRLVDTMTRRLPAK